MDIRSHPATMPQRPPLAERRGGAGRPLVLLHGGMGSWTHFQRSIPGLEAHYRVHAPDLPGFGASPDVPEATAMPDYLGWIAEHIAAIADAEGPVGLVGFSFGGAIAAAVAVPLGPAVRTLTLLGPGGFGRPEGRRLDVRRVPSDAAPQERRALLRHNLLEIMVCDPTAADDETVDLHARNIDTTRFDSRRISQLDRLTEDLPLVAAPVQLVWGERDRLAYPSVAHRAALCQAARPDLTLHVLPATGHWVQHEQPEVVNRLIAAFDAAASTVAHPGPASTRPQPRTTPT